MNEVTTQDRQTALAAISNQGAMLPGGHGMNVGAVAIEQQRAIADTRAKRLIAREYRRNTLQATQEVREVCRIPEFAGIAFFSVPRGGSVVTGDSIRMAEELARCWGNIEYGHRELSRSNEKSEVMVFAIDLETGVECSRQLTVPHVIDTKNGPKKCRDQKEIDDLINNKASKQRRGAILAVIPQWLREIARQECYKTLQGDNTVPIAVRVRKMVDAFANFGVTVKMLELKIGHKLEEATADDMVNMTGIFNALKDGEPVSEFFASETPVDSASPQAAAITAAAGKKTAAAGTAAGTVAKPRANSSKNAESASNAVKDQAAPVQEKAPQAAAPATEPEQQQQAEENAIDEANAAAAAAGAGGAVDGEEEEVF